jgi:hypothetical protein
MSFMIDDISRPRRRRFKESRAVPQDFVEYLIAQVGDCREADEVRQIVAQIIADAARREYDQDRNRDEGKDIVYRRRKELFEINRLV